MISFPWAICSVVAFLTSDCGFSRDLDSLRSPDFRDRLECLLERLLCRLPPDRLSFSDSSLAVFLERFSRVPPFSALVRFLLRDSDPLLLRCR